MMATRSAENEQSRRGDHMLDGAYLAARSRLGRWSCTTTEADWAYWSSREKIWRSGTTRWTRALVDAVNGLDRTREFAFQGA